MNKDFNAVMKFINKIEKMSAKTKKVNVKKINASTSTKPANTFDPALDKVVASTEVAVTDKGKIVVGVYSYNGGVPKIGVTRNYIKKDGGISFSPMGRLTTDEAIVVIDAMKKLLGV